MNVSVIIPVFNEAQLIAACLKSLAPLREHGFEIITVDGGSTDGSVEIAHGLSDKLICTSKGRAVQMNAGASIARGHILLFLHIDTILPRNVVKCLQAIDFSVFQWGYFSIRLSGQHPVLRLVAIMMNIRSRYTRIATGDQALFVTRLCFQQIGGFPSQPLMEDIEISKRLRAVSRSIFVHEPVVSSSRRWEQHGICRTIILMWWYRLLYFGGCSAEQLARRYYHSHTHADRD